MSTGKKETFAKTYPDVRNCNETHRFEKKMKTPLARVTIFYTWDESKLVEDEIEIVVQIKGKVRAKLMVAKDLSREELQADAALDPTVAAKKSGKPQAEKATGVETEEQIKVANEIKIPIEKIVPL